MSNLEVKIYSPKKKDGDFYVYLYDTYTQEVIKKFYKGINIYPEPEERLSAAEDLAKAVGIRLRGGWSPKKKSVLPELEVQQLTIGEAFDKALELAKSKVKSRTHANYSCLVRFVNKEVKVKKWQNEKLSNLQPHHVEDILLSIMKERNWTNKEYNRRRITLQSLFSSLLSKHLVKENIITKVPTLKSEKINPYIPLTPEEQTVVVNHFKEFLPNYNIWLKALYHTGLRPAELRFLKCSMIRLNGDDDDLFILPEEIIKTARKRIIPIPQDLKNDLVKFDLSNPDYYLFGRWKKAGWYTHEDFKPSPMVLGINTGGHVWRLEVIKKLGIQKKMYATKHKKANDSIQDGVSLEAVQKLFGHSTPITTEIYAQILELTNFRSIKDKARDFK